MPHISASLLAADYARLGNDVRRAERAGVDSFHFDMMDGHYVRNLALTPQHLKALRPYTHLPFFVHLQLTNPDEIMEALEPRCVDTIIYQADTLSDPERSFDTARAHGFRVGLSLNPEQPLKDIEFLLPHLDLLLLLGVPPGFGRQAMAPHMPTRVKAAKEAADARCLSLPIAVDGGVHLGNSRALIEAGATILVMGTALFEATDMVTVVEALRCGVAG